MPEPASLVLRLAGPLQSWGTSSQFNRRATEDRPSKSGIVGLLAAAQGRPRGADLADLCDLHMAVRVDQPGVLLTDYHTVSTLDGSALMSSNTNAKGSQLKTGPAKFTHQTWRTYLSDAVFTVIVTGADRVMIDLAEAIRRPVYPLFLGRRSCPPSGPLIVDGPEGPLWPGSPLDLLGTVPWQAGVAGRQQNRSSSSVMLSATIDDPTGLDLLRDVPLSFDPVRRASGSRPVTHLWVEVATGSSPADVHDPFTILEV